MKEWLEKNKLFRRSITLALFILFAVVAILLVIKGADPSKIQVLQIVANVFLAAFLGYQASRVIEFIKSKISKRNG